MRKRSMNYGWYFIQSGVTHECASNERVRSDEVHKAKWFSLIKHRMESQTESGLVSLSPGAMWDGTLREPARLFVAIKQRQNELISTILATLNLKDINYRRRIHWMTARCCSGAIRCSQQTHETHSRLYCATFEAIRWIVRCVCDCFGLLIQIGHGIVNNLVQLTHIWLLN